MMGVFKYISTSLILVILSFSCNKETQEDRIRVLFIAIEESIIKEAEFSPDSIFYVSDHGAILKVFVKNDKTLKEEIFTKDSSLKIAVIRYAKGGDFELRNELGKNGQIITNGILYKGEYYGPWEVNYKNSKKQYRGFRYKDKYIGDYFHYFANGAIESVVNYGNEELLDSIVIKFSALQNL